MTTVLDPTHETTPEARERAPRLDALAGKRIGLLDISKPRGDIFLDRVETLLIERGAKTERYRKPTFTKNAPIDLREKLRTECDAVLEALAD